MKAIQMLGAGDARSGRALPTYEQTYRIVRPGGIISRVGVPQHENAPIKFGSLFGGTITLTGGPAPVRAFIHRLTPAVLDCTVDPRNVFDRTVTLDAALEAYLAMDHRQALKVMITF
jgi:threonine dehydrogenase-like Zn-dependent dehydrogenase